MTDHRPTTEYFAELAREVQRMAERETEESRKRVLQELAQRIERDQSLTYDAMTIAAGYAELSLHYRLDNFATQIEEIRTALDALKRALGESKADRQALHVMLDESKADRQDIRARIVKADDETQHRLGELEQAVQQVLGLLREPCSEEPNDPA